MNTSTQSAQTHTYNGVGGGEAAANLLCILVWCDCVEFASIRISTNCHLLCSLIVIIVCELAAKLKLVVEHRTQ